MEDLICFLRARNIDEEVIKKLEHDKIDENVIGVMDIDQLKKYIPAFGDRIAVKDFCSNRLGKIKKPKKQSLIEKIREKINSKSEKEETEDLQLMTKIAKQTTRKVELGWLDWNHENKKYVQVRTKQGGGTRLMSLKKTDKKADILFMAKNLFFPNGISSKGTARNFDFDLLDFSNTSLEENINIGQMYDVTGLPKLRFYLASKKNLCPATATITSGEFLSPTKELGIDDDLNVELYNPMHFIEGDFMIPDVVTGMSSNLSQNVPDCHQSEDTETSLVSEISTPVKNTIILHRGKVMEELIEAFSEKFESNFSIEMVLPNGEIERAIDIGGVLRDCLSEFWNSFYDQCTVGTRSKVPVLRHDMNETKWKAVAKILKMGWQKVHYFPYKLAAPILEFCIFNEIKSDLTATLLKFVSASDGETLSNALVDFESVDMDEIVDIMDSLDSKWCPTKNNFAQLLADIAHKEVIQKPKFVIDCWAHELKDIMTTSEFDNITSRVLPLSKNILPMLQVVSSCEGDKGNNNEIFKYLKRFIREADEKLLSSFLRFCTGADLVTDNKILIDFKEESGFKRTPVGHTCSCTLELPNTYSTFPEFRYELSSVLNSNIWVMDII